jgi:hypothetical protein
VKDIDRYFRRDPMTINQGVVKVVSVLGRDENLLKKAGQLEKKPTEKRKKYFITATDHCLGCSDRSVGWKSQIQLSFKKKKGDIRWEGCLLFGQ